MPEPVRAVVTATELATGPVHAYPADEIKLDVAEPRRAHVAYNKAERRWELTFSDGQTVFLHTRTPRALREATTHDLTRLPVQVPCQVGFGGGRTAHCLVTSTEPLDLRVGDTVQYLDTGRKVSATVHQVDAAKATCVNSFHVTVRAKDA